MNLFSLKYTILGFAILLFAEGVSQSDSTNKVDPNGLKQGPWKGVHKNGKTRYTGQFKNDKPVGKFEYFDAYGNLYSVVTHKGDSAGVRFLHLNKETMAEGSYYLQKRTGKWKFYDSDGSISAQKFFVNGVEEGPARIYYKDGSISRSYTNKNGVEHGLLKDFFTNGKLKFEANFIDGNPHGKIKYYHSHGGIKIIGFYQHAVQDSTWTYFDVSGKVKRYEIYNDGFLRKTIDPNRPKTPNDTSNKSDSLKE